ncbi:hypothetical protein FA013_28710 [Raoultella planticola]|nr:hypothetical protein FA013_28710 [Raoultella planticola]
MFAGKKSAQIREILISESAWEEMTCLFAPSLASIRIFSLNIFLTCLYPRSIVFDENFESAMFIENINFSERSEHNFSNEGGVSDFSNE